MDPSVSALPRFTVSYLRILVCCELYGADAKSLGQIRLKAHDVQRSARMFWTGNAGKDCCSSSGAASCVTGYFPCIPLFRWYAQIHATLSVSTQHPLIFLPQKQTPEVSKATQM